MDNIQKINELRRALKELRELGTLFKSDLLEIGNAIDHERFAPAENLKAWGERLLAWINKSVECFESYAQLFKEPLPDKFSDVEKLLLLDEPSMGLAPLLIREIFNIIVDINKTGTTVLLVEQNANMALSIANRAYVLETGRITLSGDAKELAASEEVRKAYLGG